MESNLKLYYDDCISNSKSITIGANTNTINNIKYNNTDICEKVNKSCLNLGNTITSLMHLYKLSFSDEVNIIKSLREKGVLFTQKYINESIKNENKHKSKFKIIYIYIYIYIFA